MSPYTKSGGQRQSRLHFAVSIGNSPEIKFRSEDRLFMPLEPSNVVSDGMKRICSDFHEYLKQRGFEKSGKRKWVRQSGDDFEFIYLFRVGSSYGKPRNYSVEVRVQAWVTTVSEPDKTVRFLEDAGSVRKRDGYLYHHRFNAKTWSTYDRCLEEMKLCVKSEVEPWFSKSGNRRLFRLFGK